jgi:ubiquinone/menaquinone biosynthesis C-methylase UbiE
VRRGAEPGANAIACDFDRLASSYESNRLAGWYKAQAEEVLRVIEPPTGQVVVDVGCGTGWLLRQLAGRGTDFRGIGLDLSQRMIEVATELAGQSGLDQLTFIHADWERDGLEQATAAAAGVPVGVVTCVSVFHYFSDPAAALRRMRDLLAEGGQLLLLERASDGSPLTSVWGFIHRRILRDGVVFYRTEQLCRLLRESGFAQVEPLSHIRRRFWQGKLFTSLTLIEAHVGAGAH